MKRSFVLSLFAVLALILNGMVAYAWPPARVAVAAPVVGHCQAHDQRRSAPAAGHDHALAGAASPLAASVAQDCCQGSVCQCGCVLPLPLAPAFATAVYAAASRPLPAGERYRSITPPRRLRPPIA